jgi:hypothetical protein
MTGGTPKVGWNIENEPLLQLTWLGWYRPNSSQDTLKDIYDDATELRGDDLVMNIVKDDDKGVRQMWAETWKMGLYSNSPGKGDTVPILRGIL